VRTQGVSVYQHVFLIYGDKGHAVHFRYCFSVRDIVMKVLLLGKFPEVNNVMFSDFKGFRASEIPDQFYFSVQFLFLNKDIHFLPEMDIKLRCQIIGGKLIFFHPGKNDDP